LLCYVGHHDDAYGWAERRRIERHPTTGAAQLVELAERVEAAPALAIAAAVPTPPAKPPLFAGIPDDALLGYGVPPEWLARVRDANEDTLFEIADQANIARARELIAASMPAVDPLTAHDSTDPDAAIKQMGGKAVPQRVGRHVLVDPCRLGGGADDAAKLTGRQRLDRVAAGKQPASRQQQAAPSPFAPPGTQQFEQLRRQHRMAVPRFREGRLLPPLPRSTRSSIRSESMSPTFNATTSETRSPAP
jgi:hypothetical protein